MFHVKGLYFLSKMNETTYIEGFHYINEVIKMTYHDLGRTGLRVSKLSLGGAPLGGVYESVDENEVLSVVQEAIKHGINYIDTAPWYGQGRSEAVLGKALKSVPRKAYYIGTKVGRYELDVERMFDFSAARVKSSVDESLCLLGLDYVDIIQIHDLEFAENLDQIINETLPAAQEIVKEGKARAIGITGYPLAVLQEVIQRSKVKIDTVLSHSRNTLIDDELGRYMSFFQKSEIGVIDAGLVAMGLLTPGGPQNWHPATLEIKEACLKARQYCQENDLNIAALAIQTSMLTEGVATHLLGIGSYDILKQNLRTVTTPLSPQERDNVADLKQRFFASLNSKNWEGNDVTLKKLKEIRK